MLRDGQSYRELGSDYFDRLNADRLTRYHTKRLAALVEIAVVMSTTLSRPPRGADIPTGHPDLLTRRGRGSSRSASGGDGAYRASSCDSS
jgi:hypothetical protein